MVEKKEEQRIGAGKKKGQKELYEKEEYREGRTKEKKLHLDNRIVKSCFKMYIYL